MRWLFLAVVAMTFPSMAQPRFFGIHVQSKDAGTPISNVRLETTNHLVYRSDVNGNVAFYEPGLMGQRVFFDVQHPAWQFPADGFGYHGRAFDVTEGGMATLELDASPDAGASTPNPSDDQTRLLDASVPTGAARFRIRCVDLSTSRGVPLVELRTADATWVSDSAGEVALLASSTPFTATIFSHGYHLASDAGASITVAATAGTTTLAMQRDEIAERLYRVTGGGIYADSVLLDQPTPLKNPVNNAGVMGQDSVLSTLYRGQPFFIWGDTNRAAYPLGNFSSTGARAQLPDAGGLSPSVGIDLQYFSDDAGFVKPMAALDGPGPVWLSGLTTVKGLDGGEELWATYAKIISLTEVAHRGLMRFDDDQQQFVRQLTFDGGQSTILDGHPFLWDLDETMTNRAGTFVYARGPVRVPALAAGIAAPNIYQAFTALRVDGGTIRFEDGGISYAWRPGSPVVNGSTSTRSDLQTSESLWEMGRDFSTGAPLQLHDNDSVVWNAHRQRFVRLASQVAGASSYLGELYYQEGDTPMGPWVWGTKVLSHDRYTFYNPRQHPFLDENDGATIYFEGTYTSSFSGNDTLTPRYDYNQVMYRLNLDDPRLAMPVPIYLSASARYVNKLDLAPDQPPERPPFLAFEQQQPGLVPVALEFGPCGSPTLSNFSPPLSNPSFWALAPDAGTADTIPFVECIKGDNIYYGTRGFTACDTLTVLANVWPNPSPITVPIDEYSAPFKAYAGDDFCVEGDPADGGYPVPLSAASSRARSTTIARYEWTAAGETRAGRDVTFILTPGLYDIALVVTGTDGTISHDSVQVQVQYVPTIETPKSCGCTSGTELLWLLPLAALRLARRRNR